MELCDHRFSFFVVVIAQMCKYSSKQPTFMLHLFSLARQFTSVYITYEGDTGNLCSVSGSFVRHSYSQSLLHGGSMSFWNKAMRAKNNNFKHRWKQSMGDICNKNSGVYEHFCIFGVCQKSTSHLQVFFRICIYFS